MPQRISVFRIHRYSDTQRKRSIDTGDKFVSGLIDTRDKLVRRVIHNYDKLVSSVIDTTDKLVNGS
jgi:hypothetical protein